jgi:predicted ArsR family transcriptional regulator
VNFPVASVVTRAPGAARGSDDSTRERVVRAVSELGPVRASDLAERLGLTSPAVRRHLDALEADQLVRPLDHVAAGPRGRGRPARAYVLTDAGHAAQSSAYDDLAASALRFLAEEAGPGAVERFAEARVRELEARYSPLVEAAGPDMAARTDALASALSLDGYAATARPMGSGTQLCQGHCPVQHVAQAFPQLCEAEAEVFARLLGGHVQRLATLAHGEHVCTTYVPTASVSTSVSTLLPTTSVPTTARKDSDDHL